MEATLSWDRERCGSRGEPPIDQLEAETDPRAVGVNPTYIADPCCCGGWPVLLKSVFDPWTDDGADPVNIVIY